MEAREIRLVDFSYTSYLFNNKIEIGHIELEDPRVTINNDTTAKAKEENNEKSKERDLRIRKLSLNGGNLKIIENDSAQNSFFVSLKAVTVEEIIINNRSSDGKLPFDYESYSLETDSLYYNMNAEHYLTAHTLVKENEGNLLISNLKIVPKFERTEFDQQIPFEKDRMQLEVPKISIMDFTWNMKQDSIVIESSLVRMQEANLNIYRNKLLPDDTKQKPLYSGMLREMGLKLNLDTVKVENSQIVYEENVRDSRPPGTLRFDQVQITMYNVSNVEMGSEDFKETQVEAEAVFMKESQISFNWKFDVSDPMDQFTITGMLGKLSANAVNPFLKPAMNVEIEGEIESVYFNFYGDSDRAMGDMQLAYRDFKVNILKDGEEKRKSFLSGLTNLFLKNDRVNEDIEQENINVERDKTKSFWNFLFLAIRDGAIKTFL